MATTPSIRHLPPDAPPPERSPTKPGFEIDTRILTVFFFVAMPFVAFGAFMIVSMARGLLQESIGAQLEQRAYETKQQLERYVLDQFIHLRLMSQDPQVKQALAAAPRPITEEETRKLDQSWGASDPALVATVVGTPLAARLRELGSMQPGLKLLQVVDVEGRLIASSVRGGRLLNGDTAWFHAISDSMEREPYFVDIQRVANSPVSLLEIASPVRDPVDGRFVGAVRAVIDASELHSVLAPVRAGKTGNTVLMRANDGTILSSGSSNLGVLRDTFPGFTAIEAAQRERRGWWIVQEVREKAGNNQIVAAPARIVGFSNVEQIPRVRWMVAVDQDLQEATSPVQGVTRFLWLHFVASFGTVILLALYFSLKMREPVIEEELHLHEEHLPKSMQKNREA